MSDQPKKGIDAALVAVMHGLAKQGISKDGKNSQQGYRFRGIEQVYQALAPLLVANGVTIIPNVEERAESQRPTARGGVLYSVVVRVRFVLTAASDGSSTECVVWGEGMDSADKATNKAMSAAYKYMAFMAFCIPTEGMVDADAETPEETVSAPRKQQAKKVESAPAPFDSPEKAADVLGKCAVGDLPRWWKQVEASGFLPEEQASLLEAVKERKALLTQEQTA